MHFVGGAAGGNVLALDLLSCAVVPPQDDLYSASTCLGGCAFCNRSTAWQGVRCQLHCSRPALCAFTASLGRLCGRAVRRGASQKNEIDRHQLANMLWPCQEARRALARRAALAAAELLRLGRNLKHPEPQKPRTHEATPACFLEVAELASQQMFGDA